MKAKLYIMTVLDGSDEPTCFWTSAKSEKEAKDKLIEEWDRYGWNKDEIVKECYEVEYIDEYKVELTKA